MSNDNGASATMHEAAGMIERAAFNFEQSVHQLLRITKVQLKVEGMKAFNSWRTSNGMQPGYEEHHFTDLESEL